MSKSTATKSSTPLALCSKSLLPYLGRTALDPALAPFPEAKTWRSRSGARARAGTARRVLGTLALGLALVSASQPAQAAEPKIDASLKSATGFIMSQVKPKGEFGQPYPFTMTALSILALAACGHQPADPSPEGQAMRKGLDFVLQPENQTQDGYFGKAPNDNGRMYAHGITTLMLAEMAGMGVDDKQDALIRERLKLGIRLILRAQAMPKEPGFAGGWHYEPNAAGADMSVTCWQVMALRAAQNAGVEVPKEAIDKAVDYMKRMYKAVPRSNPPAGGFGYSSPGTGTSTTAEGLLAMQVCGRYEDQETIAAGNHLLREDINRASHLFYALYYYAQGMYQRGGKYADASKRIVPEILLPKQKSDGSFEGEDEGGGRVYTASMAILALAVKNHFLPIYQR